MKRPGLLFVPLLAVCLAVGGWASTEVFSPPEVAEAGDGYWSPTRCWGSSPVYGSWYGEPGRRAGYASVFASSNGEGWVYSPSAPPRYFQWVSGGIHAWYAANNHECGWAGFPTHAAARGSNYWIQYFYYPGTCDLRFIVAYDNGHNGPGIVNRYYC